MKILLNPGPVNITDSVRSALLKEDICHREKEFSDLLKSIRNKLLKIYNLTSSDYTTVVLTCSGTGAVEASICSFVPKGKKILILSNGVYGERMVKIAKVHHINVASLICSWGEEIPLDRVEKLLKSDPDIRAVGVVHHETTTGLLNPLEEISNVVKKFGKILIVDGVSSFAGEVIDFYNWDIDVLAATANKCIHGVPGCSFVIFKRKLLKLKENIPVRSIYFDIFQYHKSQEQGIPPFTPAIQVMYAFDQALDELLNEGVENRINRYKKLANLIRRKGKEIGLKLFLPEDKFSNTLTSFYLPNGISYEYLHDALKEYGFIIYAGQAGLKKKIFRIANMGEIKEEDIARFFSCIKKIL